MIENDEVDVLPERQPYNEETRTGRLWGVLRTTKIHEIVPDSVKIVRK